MKNRRLGLSGTGAHAKPQVGPILFVLIVAAAGPAPGDSERPALWRSGSTEPFVAYADQIPGTDVSFEMVPVPGGRFLRGSPPDEAGRAEDEGPRHEVIIRPFWMGRFEVTWDEYDLFAFTTMEPPLRPEVAEGPRPEQGAGASAGSAQVDAVTRPTPPYGDESFGFGKGRQPVINVTHHAAMEYTRWLSAMTGRPYRLPTEAEWEHAARAGSSTMYAFGDDPAGLPDHAWFAENAGGRPHPVGLKQPNAWGLYDMHGNAAEWCLDHYEAEAYATAATYAPVEAPVVLPTDRRYPHLARGGSWRDEAPALRSAARRSSTEAWSRRDPQSPKSIWWHTDATYVGFRVVRAMEDEADLQGLRSKVTRMSPDR